MFRLLCCLPSVVVLLGPGWLRADPFDLYVNPVLALVPGAAGVKQVHELTPAQIMENDRVLPGITSAMIVVKTNEGRYSKLLVQVAKQKLDDQASLPVLLVERYVTYKEGQERTIKAAGQNLNLFNGNRLHLDIGQVVPKELGGDLRFVAEGGEVRVEPLGKAELYLLTKPLPEASAKKSNRFVPGEAFQPRHFTGTYKLHDDGRRSGMLHLEVADDNTVSGSYYSDKDGQKYEVQGKIGTPRHSIHFTIRFPKVEEQFRGWLFTGDGKAMSGTSRLLEREAGFYAVRMGDE